MRFATHRLRIPRRTTFAVWSLLAFVLSAFPALCFFPQASIPQQEGTVDSEQDELSEEESRQIKIAERFVTVLEKSPRRGTALERVYGHHVEYGTLDEFIQGYRDRVSATPTDGSAWMILGLFESQRGQDADAVDAFKQAESNLPDDGMPAYYMGQSLILIGQPENAVEAFERAIARKPRRSDLLEIFQQLGRVHQRAQRTAEALDVWNRLEALYPDDIRVQEQIAVTLVEEGEYGQALPRYEKLATLVKDDYRKVIFQIEAAELKIRENQRDAGVNDYETMLANLNPTGWLFRDVRHRIEEVFLRAGDQDGLVKYYEKWIESNPEDVGGMARLAKFLASSARVPEATQWMEKALKLAPTRTDLRKSFIDQLMDDQRYEEAAQQYEELVKSAPGNQDFLRDWGRLVMKNKKLAPEKRKQEATRIWSRIVAARPNDALTNAQVADLYRQAKLNDDAISLYKKAIELAPKDPQYREYLGEYYHILKRPDEAQQTWSEIANGERHTAVNVARLAEVYNSFGYLDQAVEQIAEACELEPKEFTLHARASEYHMRAGKYEDAFRFIDIATSLAQNDEQLETALRGRIEVFQTSRQLDNEIERVAAELDGKSDSSAEDWHLLARYMEAARRWTDATEAIEKSLAIEPKSILALTTSARIAEIAGDYARAANMNRKLAETDRRSRSEHLMNVARLEAQMGRSDEALEAGRELIVSAPGNTDNYEFYSQLCFQLGKNEEGLDYLRKAVRINPTEPHLTMALGAALSREFRTDESIEVYWRAFERSVDIEDKTTLTQKLAVLYEQLNQFDKLTERFERDQREESKRREMTICLAQAHQTAGDFGAARRELESLLGNDTRDTNLLQQLSKLCEAASDPDQSIFYQRQLAAIAPGHETEFRLAKLLQSRGDIDEASDILVKLTRREENPYRLLRSLDSLMKQQSFESVIAITEPLLSETRDDWELLYREAVAYASMEQTPEAKLRFDRLLSLNFPHDKLGVGAQEKLKREQAKARSNNLQGIQSQLPKRQSPLSMLSNAAQVQRATGLNSNYFGGNAPEFWAPEVYGVARMAAFGWLMQFEQLESAEGTSTEDLSTNSENKDTNSETNSNKKNVESIAETETDKPKIADIIASRAAEPDAERELTYDWMYVEQLKNNYKTLFKISKQLAIQGGLEERKYFLNSLSRRGVDRSAVSYGGSGQGSPKLAPLAEDELDLMIECFEAVNDQDTEQGAGGVGNGQVAFDSNGNMYINVGGNWVRATGSLVGLSAVIKELKLAGRDKQVEELLLEKIDSADKANELAGIMSVLFAEERFDELPTLYSKWVEAASNEIALAPNTVSGARNRRNTTNKNAYHANQLQSISTFLIQWTAKLAAEEENEQVLDIMDQAFSMIVQEGKKRRVQQSSNKRRRPTSSQNSTVRFNIMYGKESSTVQVDYPRANTYVDSVGLIVLRQCFEIFKRNDVLEDLPKRLRERVSIATEKKGDELIFEQLMLGYVLWWTDEKDEAIEFLTSASEKLADDPSFRFEMAELYEKMGDFDESLAIIESINPRDQKLVQRREMKALQLAERLGDIERARSAAERLFGLRLKPETQLQLVQQMRRLGLVEMSEAVISRMQRRSGNQISSMASLMTLYQGQGKADLAEQIAHRILQRTKSPLAGTSNATRNPMRYSRTADAGIRSQALQLLQQTGALKKIVARVETQLERDPGSPRFYEQLIEFYEFGNDQKKVETILDQAVETRPDSMIFRYKLAKHYEKNAKASEACDQYLEILRRNPRWITNEFYQVQRVFQKCDRTVDLLKEVEGMNLKTFGHPSYLLNMVSNLMRSQPTGENVESKEIVVTLIERMFVAFPNYRANLLGNMNDKALWKNDRIFAIAKKGIVPGKDASVSTWHGIGNINSYSGNGTVSGSFQTMLLGIKGSKKETELYDAIEESLTDHPDWAGGKMMLGLIDLSRNRRAEGKSRLKEIFDDKNIVENMPRNVGWVIGQELEKFEDTRDLAVEILEEAVKSPSNNGMNEFRYSPGFKLVGLYSKVGRKEDARKMLIEQSRKSFSDQNNPGYGEYQHINNSKWIASELDKMGFHIDAVLVYRSLVEDKAIFESAKRWGGGNAEVEIRTGMKRALDKALNSKDPTAVMEKLLSVPEKVKPGVPAIDLLVSVPTAATFRNQSYQSQLFDMIESLGKTKIGSQALKERVAVLADEYPNDISTMLVKSFVDLGFFPDGAAESIQRLEEVLRENPLDEIPDGRRPNSRQRRQARLVAHVWLVSKRCLESDEYQQAGHRLAEVALRGARRQIGNDHVVSILYDWGQVAIVNNEVELAEKRWSELLDYVTRRPTIKKRQTDQPVPQASSPQESAPANESQKPAPSKQDSPDDNQADAGQRVPPLTRSQFITVINIAIVAAENDFPELSQRAIRKSLAGGLPVPDPTLQTPNTGPGRVITSLGNQGLPVDPLKNEVATSLVKVLEKWQDESRYPADTVYELLGPIVFPESRATDILLYEDSSGVNNGNVSSLGVTLVEWASKANRLEDLLNRIGERKETANIPATVMQVHVYLKQQDFDKASSSLQELADVLDKSSLAPMIMLGCHAALPAVEIPELELASIRILRKALTTQTASGNENSAASLGKLASIVNRHLARRGDEDAVRDFFQNYQISKQKMYSRYSGDYGIYQMQRESGLIANEAAQVRVMSVVMDYMGRASDSTSTRYGSIEFADAAVCAINYLAEKPALERYEAWRDWTMPIEGRQTVRMLSQWDLKSSIKPPAGFQSNESESEFESRELLCNFFEMIDAANEADKINELADAAKQAFENELPNGNILHMLILIRQNNLAAAKPMIEDLINSFAERMKPETDQRRQTSPWGDYLVYRACMQQSAEFANLFHQGRIALTQMARNRANFAMVTSLATDYAHRRAADLKTSIQPGDEPQLNHWLSTSNDWGRTRSWWVCDENNLTHLSGPFEETLCFKYPIVGDFKCSFDAFNGSWAEADAGYGGVFVEVHSRKRGNSTVVKSFDSGDAIRRPAARKRNENGFGRITIESKDGQLLFSLNGHLAWQEKLSGTAPWLMLLTEGPRRTAYRNFVFEGEPEIPREINLISDDKMDGWLTHFGERQPRRRTLDLAKKLNEGQRSNAPPRNNSANELNEQKYDWRAEEGILHGRAENGQSSDGQSWISYHRPLLEGESFSYEFFYSPGMEIANPAIGRLAIVLDHDVIRKHWICDPDRDEMLFGIEPDNLAVDTKFVVAESAGLKSEDWNSVSMVLLDGDVQISVNDKVIYKRPVDTLSDSRFGLFRFKNQSAKVRNVAMRGNWPEKLSPEITDNLLSTDATYTTADKRLINELVADRFILPEIDPLLASVEKARVENSPESEAYETLKDWVLPNEVHDNFRMYYKFPARKKEVLAKTGFGWDRSMICPAFELATLAVKTDKIDELIDDIKKIEPSNEGANRMLIEKGKAAMLALAAIANEDDASALESMGLLYEIMVQLDKAVPQEARAPEFVVAWQAATRPELQVAARDICRKLEETLNPNAGQIHKRRMLGIVGRVEALRLQNQDEFGTSNLTQWSGVPWEDSTTSQAGYRTSAWHLADRGVLQHIPGESRSNLFYQSPLQGSFQIHCDMLTTLPRTAFVTYGMRGSLGDETGLRSRNTTIFGSTSTAHQNSNAPIWGTMASYRIDVENSTVRTYMNGVQINETTIDGLPEPWLILYPGEASNAVGIRNLRITGEPTIPNELNLSETDMAAWKTSKFGEGFSSNVDNQIAAWIKDGDELKASVVNRNDDPESPGAVESLLTYHRPLLEDCEFEFESYYKAGEMECHPGIGLTNFILSTDGVRIHNISELDSIDRNQTGLPPGKLIDGSQPIEFKEDDWNKILVKLTGNEVTLIINGKQAAKYEIDEPIVERQFGFFRFSDKFESRIRRIRYRGNWPKSLPPVDQQELAFSATGALGVAEAKTENSTIDLSRSMDEILKDGLKVIGPAANIAATESGSRLQVKDASEFDGWPGFAYTKPIAGDFDAIVKFDDLTMESFQEGWGIGFDLEVELDDPAKTIVAVGKQADKTGTQFIKALLSHQLPNDERGNRDLKENDDGDSGRLRISRRGKMIHCLYASKDAEFELIESFIVGDHSVKQLRFMGKASDPQAILEVKAKEFRLTTYAR